MAVDLTKKPVAAIAPFGLRMQPALKAAIEAAAEANGRSMNAEIVDRLSKSLEQRADQSNVLTVRSANRLIRSASLTAAREMTLLLGEVWSKSSNEIGQEEFSTRVKSFIDRNMIDEDDFSLVEDDEEAEDSL